MKEGILATGNYTRKWLANLYFCSVVDDIDLNITDIIRGEDHITNTAIQIQIFQALKAENNPNFSHLALVKASEGKISKRIGGFDIRSLRK